MMHTVRRYMDHSGEPALGVPGHVCDVQFLVAFCYRQ